MNVLFVDGPEAGEIRDVKGWRIQAYVPATSPILGDPNDEVALKPLVYHIHRFVICGRILRLASLKLNADDINLYRVFSLIVSDKGKAVAE